MKLKHALFLVVFATIAAVGLIATDEGWSEGRQVPSYFLSTSTIDSTSAVQRDTSTAPSGSSSKIGWTRLPQDFTSISGYVWSEYTTLDTGTGGAVPDTTQDTVIHVLYTADASGTPYKEVWRDTAVAFHTTANVSNDDYADFNVSDSGLYDVLYWNLITSIQDSTYTKARLEADVHWKHGWKFFGRGE